MNNIELLLTLPDILLLSVEMTRKYKTSSRPHCLNLPEEIPLHVKRVGAKENAKITNAMAYAVSCPTRLSSLSHLNIERTEIYSIAMCHILYIFLEWKGFLEKFILFKIFVWSLSEWVQLERNDFKSFCIRDIWIKDWAEIGDGFQKNGRNLRLMSSGVGPPLPALKSLIFHPVVFGTLPWFVPLSCS